MTDQQWIAVAAVVAAPFIGSFLGVVVTRLVRGKTIVA